MILYPDLGKFELWRKKAEEIKNICASVKVTDVLEVNANQADKESGNDIADYLICIPLDDYSESSKTISNSSNEIINEFDEQSLIEISEAFANTNYDEDIWNIPINNISALAEIQEIERFFSSVELPKGGLRINEWSSTSNISSCIDLAINNAKLTAGKPHIGHQCLERLRSIKSAYIALLTIKQI